MLGLLEVLLLLSAPVLMVISLLRQRRSAGPNEVLLVCGRRGLMDRGFALVRGTTIVVPWIEAAELISLEPIQLKLERRLRTSSGSELDFEIAATISYPERTERLLETFELSPTLREALIPLAEDALGGSAAHVVAVMEASELVTDLAKLADVVAEEARPGLEALGLEVDNVTIIPSRGAQLPA
jgi:uncharacterized membrane protein YqiK